MSRNPSKTSEWPCLLFPGETAWECWRMGRDGAAEKVREMSPEEMAGFVPPGRVLVALPAQATLSVPFRAFGKDEREFRSAAGLELEKQGLVQDLRPGRFGVEILDREGDQAVLRIDVLGSWETAWPDGVLAEAGFAVAPRLFPVGARRAYLWTELGRVVGAVGREGGLLYASVIHAPRLDEGAVEEVIRWCRRFQLRGLAEVPEEIVVWGGGGEAFPPREVGKIPVRTEPRPAPRWEGVPLPQIVPERVEALRSRRMARRRSAAWATGTGAVAVVAAALFLTMMAGERRERGALRAREAELLGDVGLVRQAQARWNEVRAAVDPDASPLETMKRIHDLPSARNIQLTHLQLREEGIALRGSASSPAAALAFLSDLANHPDFGDLTWTYPQPEMTRDGRGMFEIEGKVDEEEAGE